MLEDSKEPELLKQLIYKLQQSTLISKPSKTTEMNFKYGFLDSPH